MQNRTKNLGKYAQKGNIPWNKGLKGVQISANKGKHFNIKHEKQFKKGMIPWNKGKKEIRIEVLKKQGEAHLGKKAWNSGKKYEQIIGKNHPNWKGGITPINHKIRQSFEMKQWKKVIFERDNYRCFDCGARSGEIGKALILHADHIYQFSKYNRLRFVLENGQTLCVDCHKQKTIFERTGRMKLNSLITV